MAKRNDLLGNTYSVKDTTITIDLERYNQLIIAEHEHNKEHAKISKESEDKKSE